MAAHRVRNDKEKGVSTSGYYDRAKVSSCEAKLQFEKSIEVNKSFIVERGMNFDLRPNVQFEGIIEVIVLLG